MNDMMPVARTSFCMYAYHAAHSFSKKFSCTLNLAISSYWPQYDSAWEVSQVVFLALSGQYDRRRHPTGPLSPDPIAHISGRWSPSNIDLIKCNGREVDVVARNVWNQEQSSTVSYPRPLNNELRHRGHYVLPSGTQSD